MDVANTGMGNPAGSTARRCIAITCHCIMQLAEEGRELAKVWKIFKQVDISLSADILTF